MASGFVDTPMAVRAIDARTNSAGAAVTDLSAEEERMANIFVSGGWISPADSFEVVADTSWNVAIGSGPSNVDHYVVEGTAPGQGNYIVRLNQAAFTVALNPADLSNDRYDEVYLVVLDDAYDSSGLALPRIAVREGDPAASPAAPGPLGSWKAYARLASILVPAGAASIAEATIYDTRYQAQSNVDAPTLEGNEASAFATAGHTHAAYAPKSHEGSSDGHPEAVAGVSDGMLSWQDKSKLNAIEAGAEANLSASEILNLIKTVDGSGSGLDADLLDGQEGSAFALSGHNHDSRYYTESEANAELAPLAAVMQQSYMRRSSGATINDAEVAIVWYAGDEEIDDWDGHFGNDNYVKDGPAGYYLVEAQVTFSAHASGNVRQFRIFHNEDGNVAIGREKPVTASGEATIVRAQAIVYMDGSDYIRIYAYQDSGASLTIQATNTWLKLTYLGG